MPLEEKRYCVQCLKVIPRINLVAIAIVVKLYDHRNLYWCSQECLDISVRRCIYGGK